MRDTISARFLLAEPPPAVVDISGITITKCRPRVATGARKPRIAARGDAPTIGHAARDTATIYSSANRSALLNYAATNRQIGRG